MRKIAALLFLFAAPLAGAEVHWWAFEGRSYYDPLIAGVRDPNVSALIPAYYDRMSFMTRRDTKRIGWDIDLGTELPIFGRESVDQAGQDFSEGNWGWGVWIPIDFHMIEDFRDESAPIVNTDYRFGAMFKFRRGLANNRALAARVHVGHESTHLGDEFSINGQRAFPNSFERINVSWEYLDTSVLYEWLNAYAWNTRAGVTATLPFASSYYQTGPGTVTQSAIGPVTESKNWFDPYVGFEVLKEEALFKKKWDVYVSGELRWRTVYDYHKADPGDSEDREASLNLIVGTKKNGSGTGIGRASPFLRFYRGVNPHGQFRNQKDYTEIGFGVRLVR